jgi:RNA polymerase sigma-70 factor, ECF subfamily
MSNIKNASDIELVKQFNKGSHDAFNELYLRYEEKAYNLAMRLVRNKEDAEEVIQEVFITVYRKLNGFEGKSQFSSWLYRVTTNCAFMKLRKRKSQVTTSLDEMPSHTKLQVWEESPYLRATTGDDLSRGEVRVKLEAAVEKLPEVYRSVFLLRDVDGMSNNDVAVALGISLAAVKSRLHRARVMLKRRLHKYYEEFAGVSVNLEAIESGDDSSEEIFDEASI